mgnify:CR=1 FL=1
MRALIAFLASAGLASDGASRTLEGGPGTAALRQVASAEGAAERGRRTAERRPNGERFPGNICRGKGVN